MTEPVKGSIDIEDRGRVLIARADGGPHGLFGADLAGELDDLVDRVDADSRPIEEPDGRLSGQSPAFHEAFRHVLDSCDRIVATGRVTRATGPALASQLWTIVHGFITLELADHYSHFDDPLTEILAPIGVNLYVGLGDTRERALRSHGIDDS